jgi:isopenicillin-N N-acyltransferase like protein
MQPELVRLNGDAVSRGRGQAIACPDAADQVRDALAKRLIEGAALLARDDLSRFVATQREITAALSPASRDEIAGIATGFGLDRDAAFAALHLAVLADMAAAEITVDGCTAFARRLPGSGGRVAKNRDFRPDHVALQRVFIHRDPAWRGRSLVTLGSLGAPGAYSSGMNSDGLALADTQIPTALHGPGLLRYFVMTEILVRCARVGEAIAYVQSVAQLGGGSLVLADAAGDACAIELRHGRVDVERIDARGWVARTNHFLAAPERLPHSPTSIARLASLETGLRAGADAAPRRLLAQHAPVALCRHGGEEPGGSFTLAGAIYDCAERRIEIAFGAPCTAPWRRIALVGDEWQELAAGTDPNSRVSGETSQP